MVFTFAGFWAQAAGGYREGSLEERMGGLL